MPIIPETLKALRDKRGLSQQGLAERAAQIKGASVSKRTIARIESGEIASAKVRPHTVESLAKALEVAPEALGKPVSETDTAKMQERGYRRLSVWLSEDVRRNYRWTTHHYDVSVRDLIDAAPWMFTLLAEMSLSDRRRRLEAANAAFEDAMRRLPAHLSHGAVGCGDFDHAYEDEKNSLAHRDVFGRIVLETDHGADRFDPSATNPFVEFLRKVAGDIGSAEVDPEYLELPYGGGMPRWTVFENWLHQLTGGDALARCAVEKVEGVIDTIPENLKGEARTAERVAFLIDRMPPDLRAREEARLAEQAAWFAKAEAGELTLEDLF